MKTILINIYDSTQAKNILRTDVFEKLREKKDIKIVLLVPQNKSDFYKKEFSSDNVAVDIWLVVGASKLEQFVLFAGRNSIPTHTVRQIQETGLDGTGMKWYRYIFARLFWLLGHIYLWRRLISAIGYFFFQDAVFNELLKKYQPDLIFLPTIFATNDLRLFKSARKNSIPVVGMIKSWDNLTSKDPLLIKPDWLIVHNEIVKDEAIKIGRYPEGRIFVSGVPQFDIYASGESVGSKEDFFRKMGIDPNKKLILFLAVGSYLAFHEKEMIEFLGSLINGNQLKYPCQLLVRLHPAFTSDEDKLKSIPNIIVDRPGKFRSSVEASLKDGWDFDKDDIRHLAETLKWSDVAVNFGSTTLIEAAMTNTPVILLGFDAIYEPDYWHAARRLEKREHIMPVIKSKGVRLAGSREELIKFLNDYLADRNPDKENRKRLVREQNYKEDGRAGERIADFLVKSLNL